jgi:hypothetical protein
MPISVIHLAFADDESLSDPARAGLHVTTVSSISSVELHFEFLDGFALY